MNDPVMEAEFEDAWGMVERTVHRIAEQMSHEEFVDDPQEQMAQLRVREALE